ALVFAGMYFDPDEYWIIHFLLLPMLSGSLFLRRRSALLLTLGGAGGAAFLLARGGQLNMIDVGRDLATMVLIGLLIIFATSLQRRDADLIAQQAQQLAKNDAQLHDLIEQLQHRGRTLEGETEALGRSNKMLTALHGVAARLPASRSQKEILDILGDELKRIGLCHVVQQYDSATDELVIHSVWLESNIYQQAERMVGKSLVGLRFPLKEQLLEKVIKGEKPAFLSDPVRELSLLDLRLPKILIEKILQLVLGKSQMGYIVLPLNLGQSIFGSLMVWDMSLRAEDVKTFQVFATEVSIALENSRLLAESNANLAKIEQQARRLADSEAQFRSLLENAYDAVMVIDARGKIRYASPSTARVIGYTLDEMREMEMPLHPDDLPAFTEFSKGLGSQPGTTRNVVLRYRVKSGEWRWLEATAVNLLHEPFVQGIVVNFRDVTERKRIDLELETKAKTMTLLYLTTLDLVTRHELPTLLQLIVERAASLLGTDSGGLYLCEPAEQQARCVISHNTLRDYAGTVLKYGEGAAGRVAQTGQPLIINDYHRWNGQAKIYAREKPFHKVLSVPITWADEVIGVLHILANEHRADFTEDDQKLAMLFANQAAVAVQNARLIEKVQSHAADLEQRVAERTYELQQHAAELENIHRITEKLLSTQDLDAIQSTVTKRIATLLDFSAVTIVLYDETASCFLPSFIYPPVPEQARKLPGVTQVLTSRVPYQPGQSPLLDQLVQDRQTTITHSLAQIVEPYLPRQVAEIGQRITRIESYIGIPLVNENRTIGLLIIASERPEISERERSALELVAGQLAIAISRTRHYQASQERAVELARAMSQMEHEIDERRQAEARLTASLKEKEVLLREVYHRVKNNLQVIGSLINLQASKAQDEVTRQFFHQTRTRINAMALVHEKLYQSPSLAIIDFSEYLKALLNNLFRAFLDRPGDVRLELEVDPIWLGLDTAIPCGLILNELISNSLEHAFPPGKLDEPPKISVGMRECGSGRYELTVADNGIGLPDDFDWQHTNSLGMELVNLLTAQIGGEAQLKNNHGAKFTITFAELKYKERG
ncbi:MAG: GAF domain-containing protein, partial [Chloroflexota bacterium]